MNNINRGVWDQVQNSVLSCFLISFFFIFSLFFATSTDSQTHRSFDSFSSWFMRYLLPLFFSSSIFLDSRFVSFTDLNHRIVIFHFPLRLLGESIRSVIFVVFGGDFSRSIAPLRFPFRKKPVCNLLFFTLNLNLTQSLSLLWFESHFYFILLNYSCYSCLDLIKIISVANSDLFVFCSSKERPTLGWVWSFFTWVSCFLVLCFVCRTEIGFVLLMLH